MHHDHAFAAQYKSRYCCSLASIIFRWPEVLKTYVNKNLVLIFIESIACIRVCCSVSSILIIDITNTYLCLFLLLLTYCFQIFVNARLIIFCTIFDCRLILHSLSHLCINFINFLIYYNNNC